MAYIFTSYITDTIQEFSVLSFFFLTAQTQIIINNYWHWNEIDQNAEYSVSALS